MVIFIIEHLEPELYPWCLIEYENISKIVGKKNLWFTNIKVNDKRKLRNFGKVFSKSIKSFNLTRSCILDPESKSRLNYDNTQKIEYYIFGGILGDFPPKKRTSFELSKYMKGVKKFNIGKEQMSTDNAVYTVKKIIEGNELSKMRFQDGVDIKINDILTTQLPYRYNLIKQKPFISKRLIKFIKNRDKK